MGLSYAQETSRIKLININFYCYKLFNGKTCHHTHARLKSGQYLTLPILFPASVSARIYFLLTVLVYNKSIRLANRARGTNHPIRTLSDEMQSSCNLINRDLRFHYKYDLLAFGLVDHVIFGNSRSEHEDGHEI